MEDVKIIFLQEKWEDVDKMYVYVLAIFDVANEIICH